MQSAHSFLLRHRFSPRSLAARSRPAAVGSSARAAPLVSERILCLRLAHQLCAENADALVEIVTTRVLTAVQAPTSVVLDLSATPALPDGAGTTLQSLYEALADRHVRLWLVLPGAQTRASFLCDRAGNAIAPECIHTSARSATLAAYASLPGAALISSAMRELLSQPPELLTVSAQAPPP